MKAKAFVLIPHSNKKATEIEWMVSPLVMCCDCEHYDGDDNFCTKNGLIVPDGGRWFCADGERREADADTP